MMIVVKIRSYERGSAQTDELSGDSKASEGNAQSIFGTESRDQNEQSKQSKSLEKRPDSLHSLGRKVIEASRL